MVTIMRLSVDKVCQQFEFFWGLKLAKSQADALLNRLAREWGLEFDTLCTLLANSAVVHADEMERVSVRSLACREDRSRRYRDGSRRLMPKGLAGWHRSHIRGSAKTVCRAEVRTDGPGRTGTRLRFRQFPYRLTQAIYALTFTSVQETSSWILEVHICKHCHSDLDSAGASHGNSRNDFDGRWIH